MTDSEKKAWEEMLEVAKRNLSMPITDERFRMAQQVFLAKDAECRSLKERVEKYEAAEAWLKRSYGVAFFGYDGVFIQTSSSGRVFQEAQADTFLEAYMKAKNK